MSIAIVNVNVPAAGFGAAADISALVGKKTVILTGTFTGRYVLYGSHDGTLYVPVLIFDANGDESIKLTFSQAFRFVRLFANASNAAGVAVSVSGVSRPGDNRFSAVATLPAGFTGTTPVIDLFALFPPTGLEQDINVICRGNFSGIIEVEGSNDGIGFNAMGSFRGGQQGTPLLGAQTLEFSPLSIDDQVRYIRLRVNAVLTTPVLLTGGGMTPFAGPGPGGETMLELSDDEGKVALDDTEVILYEWAINLSDLTVGANVTVQLNAILQAIGGGTANFRVYVGSTTPGNTTGGTLRASTSTASATEVVDSVTGAAFANPGGTCLVQVTGFGSVRTTSANVRGVSVNIG